MVDHGVGWDYVPTIIFELHIKLSLSGISCMEFHV